VLARPFAPMTRGAANLFMVDLAVVQFGDPQNFVEH